MSRSHIPVALGDGSRNAQISVLPVHVVGSRTGIVPQPNTEVLDLERRLFRDLFHGNDLAGGLLELLQLAQEVPETGFCYDLIRSENPHFVERSCRLLLSRKLASDDFELLQLMQNQALDLYTYFHPQFIQINISVMFSNIWKIF